MVRTSRGFRPTYVEPAVTADIKTNSGNVCEYWDASCHIQQGIDSINEGIIQAGEDVTSWGDEVTVTIQESYVENIETPIVQGVENIQDAYVENIETPIVKGVENVQDAIDKAKKDNETYWEIQNANYDKWVKDTQKEIDDAAANLAKNTQDAFNATIKAAQDASDKAAKDAHDAFNATIKAAQDAADATAQAAADAAAAAGEGATKGMTDTLKIAGVAALGIGVLLVMKK